MRELLLEPTTFFIPTSLALVEALAVDKLIKLIHATIRMNIAMMMKI
jgi:hypothetical protein